jgi:hypothetical protein
MTSLEKFQNIVGGFEGVYEEKEGYLVFTSEMRSVFNERVQEIKDFYEVVLGFLEHPYANNINAAKKAITGVMKETMDQNSLKANCAGNEITNVFRSSSYSRLNYAGSIDTRIAKLDFKHSYRGNPSAMQMLVQVALTDLIKVELIEKEYSHINIEERDAKYFLKEQYDQILDLYEPYAYRRMIKCNINLVDQDSRWSVETLPSPSLSIELCKNSAKKFLKDGLKSNGFKYKGKSAVVLDYESLNEKEINDLKKKLKPGSNFENIQVFKITQGYYLSDSRTLISDSWCYSRLSENLTTCVGDLKGVYIAVSKGATDTVANLATTATRAISNVNNSVKRKVLDTLIF